MKDDFIQILSSELLHIDLRKHHQTKILLTVTGFMEGHANEKACQFSDFVNKKLGDRTESLRAKMAGNAIGEGLVQQRTQREIHLWL